MFSLEKLKEDFQTTYSELTYIKDDSYWKNYIYSTSDLPYPADRLDCSFLCRNVEKPNGCDLFLFEVSRKNFLDSKL